MMVDADDWSDDEEEEEIDSSSQSGNGFEEIQDDELLALANEISDSSDVADEDDDELPAKHFRSCPIKTSGKATSEASKYSVCSMATCGCKQSNEDDGCCDICRFYFECRCNYCGYARGQEGNEKYLSARNNVIKKVALEENKVKKWRRDEKAEYMRTQVELCIIDHSNPKRFRFAWKVGHVNDSVNCCYQGFLR